MRLEQPSVRSQPSPFEVAFINTQRSSPTKSGTSPFMQKSSMGPQARVPLSTTRSCSENTPPYMHPHSND
jgi:hypothetical protein